MKTQQNQELTETIQRLIDQGALFFCSHSGGKDSQAMYSFLTALVPQEQIVVVHAHLGEIEWAGVQQHITDTIDHPLHVVTGNWKDGTEKTFFDMVEGRHEKLEGEKAPWPSSAMRYCTSDLKRDPIHKFIRNICKERGINQAVNCTGIRAQESAARAKQVELSTNKKLTNQTRTVWDWKPIFNWTTEEVFSGIELAGQEPFWAYQGGNERLSCMFCIMGSDNDLRHAARVNPELAQKYIDLEHRTGFTMFMNKSLESIIATDLQQ